MHTIYKPEAVFAIILIFGIIHTSKSVKINKLQVPEVILHSEPVVLDCDFTLEDNGNDQDGLVVKWFFNKTANPVYQWIPDLGLPQDSGILKGRLNLDYSASLDKNSKHRALHILKPGPDLSGDYTCSISTYTSEDKRTKSMLVYVPGRSLTLKKLSADEGYMRVQCSADGVFPKPVMILRSQEREITEADVSVRKKGQLFDITALVTLPAPTDPQEFSCELRIPQANYTVRKETVFSPGNAASGISSIRWLPLVYYLTTAWTKIVHLYIGS